MKKTKPFLIHIPKTAGQSIHKALGERNGPHRRIAAVSPGPRRWVFSVVRNPYDRAVSLFHWYRELHLKPRKKRTPHNAAMNILALGCEDVNEFYLRFIDADTLKYQRRYTPMMAPQSSFLVTRRDPEKISPRLDQLIRFEDLGTEWEKMREKFELAELPHINKSQRKAWGEELSEASREVIQKLYASDFALLGYER